MKRIYLFEGADGCGKSVLATALTRELGAILTRHGPYPGADGSRLMATYLSAMLPAYANLAHVVMDRSWISEPIYGEAYRGNAGRLSVAQRRMLERVALGRGATVVLARAPWKTCAENFRRRAAEGGEYLPSVEKLKVVYDAYKNHRPFTSRVARYDYTRNTQKDDFARVLYELEPGLEVTDANLGPGIGAWRPGGKVTLLVGERPGGFGGRWHLPFVSLRADGCSAWLTTQLEEAQVPESALYWVNAWDGLHHPTMTRGDFFEELLPRAVFCLGDTAAKWCREVGIRQYAVLPHPQAWKRFHSKQPYPLLKELQACK